MIDRAALLEALLTDPGKVAEIPPKEAADLLARVAVIQAALAAQVVARAPTEIGAEPRPPMDRLLSPSEAGRLLGVTVRWLYDHADKLPFTRRLSRKALRFSERGLEEYMRR